MGHWPIESSNLSLSANAFWSGLTVTDGNTIVDHDFAYFEVDTSDR
jgi:hypothetical protein